MPRRSRAQNESEYEDPDWGQATNQGGMRVAQRAELQQLTNLRQTEVLQQRKQHQAEFQRRQQQRLASAEHAHDQDENSNPASAMESSDGAGVEAEVSRMGARGSTAEPP